MSGCYTGKEKDEFDRYLQSRIDKIDIPGKDESFLRERLLEMYANLVRNQLKACSDK